jgi:ribonuclease HI
MIDGLWRRNKKKYSGRISAYNDLVSKPAVDLFTDGSCPSNPGPGGWAYILRLQSGTECKKAGSHSDTTNNRMELTGVIEALKSLPRPCTVTLYSDSQYVTKGIQHWLPAWKRRNWVTSEKLPVKNADLWQQIDDLKKRHDLKVQWVKGHDGHPENEECDRLAGEACRAGCR